MFKKRYAPYGKEVDQYLNYFRNELRLQEIGSIRFYIGIDAFKQCVKFNNSEPVIPAFCLPDLADPFLYKFPVKGLNVLMIESDPRNPSKKLYVQQCALSVLMDEAQNVMYSHNGMLIATFTGKGVSTNER